MAEAIYKSESEIIDYTPGSAVASGQVVVVNGRCFVAHEPIAANALGSLYASGLFDLTKQSGVTFSAGDVVYWDDTNNYANATSSNTLFGVAIAAAASGDATVRCVLLNLVNPLSIGSLANVADGGAGMGFVVRKDATASGDTTVWTTTRKVKVVNCWMVSRDTTAANVKLHQGTAGADDITNATAKGTTTNALVAFGQIVAAKEDVASATAIKVNLSGAASVSVYLHVLPIA